MESESEEDRMNGTINRREFLKLSAAVTAAASIAPTGGATIAEPAQDVALTVRIPGRPYTWNARMEKGRIAGLEKAEGKSTDLWLTRGLVDIQVNGYMGVKLTSPDLTLEGLETCEKALAAQGLVRWCPTITTQDPALIREVLAKIALGIEKGALRRVLFIHTEANWLSAEEGYRGAHIARFMQDPTTEQFDSWQAAAKGHIGYVSVAPERKGAIEFIRYLSGKGILVALAHHNADYPTIQAAAGAGARLSTHLFNGCASMIPRHNNVIFHQLSEERLWASFIPDGHHIPHHVLSVGLRAKGLDRSVFVSDLISLGGMPEGEYQNDEAKVEVRDGAVFLKGTPYLSGAWCSLAQGIARATASGIIDPGDALRLASLNPARLTRMGDDLEAVVGAPAPFVIFREENGSLRLDRILT
jgi:N-acetylglucosamine-6-phosphate deacetylase